VLWKMTVVVKNSWTTDWKWREASLHQTERSYELLKMTAVIQNSKIIARGDGKHPFNKPKDQMNYWRWLFLLKIVKQLL
jgi:hypothetical protein